MSDTKLVEQTLEHILATLGNLINGAMDQGKAIDHLTKALHISLDAVQLLDNRIQDLERAAFEQSLKDLPFGPHPKKH